MKQFKIKEVIKAIRKNGLKKHKYYFYDYGKTPTAGCAVGQAARNLNVNAEFLLAGLNKIYLRNDAHHLGSKITRLNDETEMTLSEIADKLEARIGNVEETVPVPENWDEVKDSVSWQIKYV